MSCSKPSLSYSLRTVMFVIFNHLLSFLISTPADGKRNPPHRRIRLFVLFVHGSCRGCWRMGPNAKNLAFVPRFLLEQGRGFSRYHLVLLSYRYDKLCDWLRLNDISLPYLTVRIPYCSSQSACLAGNQTNNAFFELWLVVYHKLEDVKTVQTLHFLSPIGIK